MSEVQEPTQQEEHKAAKTLPPQMQQVLQALCDTYEKLDLRIETTLDAAESDFLKALPELEGHEDDLRRLVKILTTDLRRSSIGSENKSVILRLAFKDEADLTEQFFLQTKMQETAS